MVIPFLYILSLRPKCPFYHISPSSLHPPPSSQSPAGKKTNRKAPVVARRPKTPFLPQARPCPATHAEILPPQSSPSVVDHNRRLRHWLLLQCRASQAAIAVAAADENLVSGQIQGPKIKVPTLVLQLNSNEVLRREDALDAIDVAVSKWARIVVLHAGEGSAGRLYEAARALKSIIGEMTYLLIGERVDVAAAVGASGVVLSDQGR